MKVKDVDYRLYLVSDRTMLKNNDLIQSLKEAILGGITLIQLREKDISSLDFYQLALEVKELAQMHNIPLIINDRIDIAIAVGADGVHIGQSDLPANIARKIIGQEMILGVSATTLEEAQKAVADGADYLGIGALFPTNTKDDAKKVSLEQLALIKNSVDVPIVGIGGISKDNAKSVLDTDIEGLAIVSAILAQEKIKEAAQELKNLF